MGYNSNIYKRALEIKRKFAKKQRAEYEQSLQAVYASFPELYDIDAALSKNGAKAAVSAISGDMQTVNELKEQSLKLSAKKQKILKKANVGEYSPICHACNDSGYNKTKLCECVRQIAKGIMIEELKASVPVDASTFDSFNLDYYSSSPDEKTNGTVPKQRMSEIFRFSKNYAEQFSKNSPSLLFLGGAGLGKTHLSVAIGAKAVENGFGVIYSTAQNLLSALEKEYFSHNDNEYLETVLNCDLVIIDDLGTEFSTQFTQSALYNIINTRILKELPTIISTNLSFAELEQRYTARIASRLAGSYVIKKFLGRDIRIIKATEQMQ